MNNKDQHMTEFEQEMVNHYVYRYNLNRNGWKEINNRPWWKNLLLRQTEIPPALPLSLPSRLQKEANRILKIQEL